MSRSPVVRSIDIGYGNTKFIVDDTNRCAQFPSRVLVAAPYARHTDIIGTRAVTRVLVGNNELEVGPDSVYSNTVPELHEHYIDTRQYKALFHGALVQMQLRRIDVLVTGLPVHLHAGQSSRLRELLQGRHEVQQGRFVDVKDVIVVPQPLGGFVAHTFDSNFLRSGLNRNNLLIDPGYYTFDWIVANGMIPKMELTGSIPCGMFRYIQRIQDAYCNANAVEPWNMEREIEMGIRTGEFHQYGKPVDLTPYLHAGESVLDEAMHQLRNRIGDAAFIDQIFLVGGGSQFFERPIRNLYPNHSVSVVADPVCANVRGFQIIGQTMIQNRAAS
jgi:plasmid segregation protein ParM